MKIFLCHVQVGVKVGMKHIYNQNYKHLNKNVGFYLYSLNLYNVIEFISMNQLTKGGINSNPNSLIRSDSVIHNTIQW